MEIIADILLFCGQPKSKARIMFSNNLNYAQLLLQVRFLTAQGMLSLSLGKYATTEKGNHFVDFYLKTIEILNDEKV